MKNIRLILVGELVLFIIVCLFIIMVCGGGIPAIGFFLDIPSLLFIIMILIPGLLVMGEWKDFIKSFSVGIRHYSLLELKNIVGAVSAAQKLTVFAALFAIITSGIMILATLDDLSTMGPNLAVCFLSGYYAVIIEYFLLPLRLNAEKKMNEEMDLGDE